LHLVRTAEKKGKAYFSYLDLTATNEVSDMEHLPLIFAFQLAKALKAGNSGLHVADDILTDDLKCISEEFAAHALDSLEGMSPG
jgi:hypothetical protein